MESAALRSRTLAVDAANVIYRHFFQIRDSSGRPYRNPNGRVIGHLIGLCHEISLICRLGASPVFVLDGATPDLKEETMRRREEDARGFRIDNEMKEEMVRALGLLGIPFVRAPEEAEAQAAHMTSRDCWAVVTNDYDALLFGAARMIRSVSARKTEVCVPDPSIPCVATDRRFLVALGILIGTDYNPGGIRGIGPKRALDLLCEHGSLGPVLDHLGASAETLDGLLQVEDYYLNPPVTEDWDSGRRKPDGTGSRQFLVDEMLLDAKFVGDLLKLLGDTRTRARQTSLPG